MGWGCDGVSVFSEDEAYCGYYGEVYFESYEGEVAYFDVFVEVACFHEGVHEGFHEAVALNFIYCLFFIFFRGLIDDHEMGDDFW